MNTHQFKEYTAIVNRVIDGDTIVVDLDLGFQVTLHNRHVRLADANAPEKDCPAGVESKVWLTSVLLNKTCTLVVDDKNYEDKYGRVLAKVMLGNASVGEMSKLAGEAHGGPGRKDVTPVVSTSAVEAPVVEAPVVEAPVVEAPIAPTSVVNPVI